MWISMFALIAASVAIGAAGAAQAPRDEQRAAAIVAGPAEGPWRGLFLDDEVIASQHNLRRVFHVARKHPGNPIIPESEPWEGSGPYIHGTVFPDGSKLRMWYAMWNPEGGRYMQGYAESRDGLHWTKPRLGLCEFGGSRQNNLVLFDEKAGAGLAGNLSVAKRPWEPDPDKRYAAFFISLFPEFHLAQAYSPDGLDWAVAPDAPKGLRSNDEMRVFFDPYRKRYVATCKDGDEQRGRAVRVQVSADGLSWEHLNEGKLVMASEETGKTANQIYNMPVFPYQGLYVGLPNVYHAGWPSEEGTPTTADIEVAWSRDLVRWLRPAKPGRRPLIRLGREGEFDSGLVMGVANAPVVVGDELWFYYGGWDGPHSSVTRHAAIGLATLRLDGFAAMRAGDDEGWLITAPQAFSRPAITINAKVRSGGTVLAELLDGDGRVVPGFARGDCRPFSGDSVQHDLTWKSRAFVPRDPRHSFAIRFFLRNGELYSYLPW